MRWLPLQVTAANAVRLMECRFICSFSRADIRFAQRIKPGLGGTMNQSYRHLRIDESLFDRVTIWFDVEARSVNVFSEPVLDELRAVIEWASQRGKKLPLVFRSAKRHGFVVGADLRRLLSIETEAELRQFLAKGQTVFERLEQFDGLSVAVIQGACLGGGLELALACNFRLAVDVESTQLGMPEATLSLMPGWGGTQRLIRTVGVTKGLAMLLTGQAVDALRARDFQLVDSVIAETDLEPALTSFLGNLVDPVSKKASVCGRSAASNLAACEAELAEFDLHDYGTLSPAQAAIYQAVSMGITDSTEAGLRAEREFFYPLLMSAAARQSLQRFANR